MNILNAVFGWQDDEKKYAPVEQDLENPLKVYGSKNERNHINAIINRVAKSQAGRAVLETAAIQGYSIAIDSLDCHGSCSKISKQIMLDTSTTDDKLVSTLAHEARHAEQFTNGAIHEFNPSYTLASEMMEKRLMEADAVAYSILVCDELSQAGDKMPMIEAAHAYTQIVRGYNDGKQNAPTGNAKQDAMTYAMMSWFIDTPLKMTYEVNHLIRPLSLGFAFKNTDEKLKDIDLNQSIANICKLDGKPYCTADAEDFKDPLICGISTSAKEWLGAHAISCSANGIKMDPSLEKIPVYNEGRANQRSVQSYPEPLSDVARDAVERKKIKDKIDHFKTKVSTFFGGR